MGKGQTECTCDAFVLSNTETIVTLKPSLCLLLLSLKQLQVSLTYTNLQPACYTCYYIALIQLPCSMDWTALYSFTHLMSQRLYACKLRFEVHAILKLQKCSSNDNDITSCILYIMATQPKTILPSVACENGGYSRLTIY